MHQLQQQCSKKGTGCLAWMFFMCTAADKLHDGHDNPLWAFGRLADCSKPAGHCQVHVNANSIQQPVLANTHHILTICCLQLQPPAGFAPLWKQPLGASLSQSISHILKAMEVSAGQ